MKKGELSAFNNDPLTIKLPLISNVDWGTVVPIPNLPVELSLILSWLFVPNSKSAFW